MKSLKIKSRAKINITLDVLNKRSDGYHNVKMIMQTIGLYDDIYIEKISKGIYIKTNLPYLPTNQKNIAYKAAQLFLKTMNIKNTGVQINIHKNIPVSAGLAGGSSNAAAVLIGMNRMFDSNLTTRQLMDMGKKLGADVPYCVVGGTVLAEGIGDVFTMLPPMPHSIIVLAKPQVRVSTAYAYSKLDCSKIKRRPNTEAVINDIYNHNIMGIAKGMYNVLETVTAKEYGIINKIKTIMIGSGALGAVMSGSGPTVFGIFSNEVSARNAAKKLYTITRDVFTTTTEENINI